ncbi:hypothetical protein C8R45DRAFT_1115483 [Mycena sanguinolenta]|nr:hypothetical protein C8R45DRAFT_1115483 [Mycena sanguinolenta]
MTILSSAPRQEELVPILCAIVNFSLTLGHLDQLFDLENSEACRSHHFYVGDLDHRMTVARSFLRLCASGGYQPGWYPGEPGSPRNNLIPFLISLPPSPELCPLIASMDFDCTFSLKNDQFGGMLSWLKKIPSAPQDLIEPWEDYVFMCSIADDHTTCVVKHILSPSSELCQALIARVFLGMGIRDVRRLLDIKWTEFRTILCSVRPNIASDPEQVLHGSPRDVVHVLVPPEMQQVAFRELALKWIHRVIKSHVGVDDAEAWYYLSTVLRHCPPCDILYREFQSIPLRVMQAQIPNPYHSICEWFKSFGDPTLELVALWTQNQRPLTPESD